MHKPAGRARRSGDGLHVRESVSLLPLDVAQQDDDLLDGWLVSLTADQFEQMLDSLARLRVEGSAAASYRSSGNVL